MPVTLVFRLRHLQPFAASTGLAALVRLIEAEAAHAF